MNLVRGNCCPQNNRPGCCGNNFDIARRYNCVQNCIGRPGMSAYELAVRQGYIGTIDEWLQSINGKSAYEIAVEQGYIGTINEWLQSINGKSAYEIAVEQGYVGTIDEWLQSINGKSAYEIAVEQGYVGTIDEWLQSINGKSAYEIAVEQGYVGTIDEWLESLKGEFDTGEKLFSIITQGGTADIGFEDSISFNSQSMDISVDPDTLEISIESKPVGVDAQFYSNANDVRLESGISGGRVYVALISNGYEPIANTGGVVTAPIPLISYKVLRASVIKEIHAMMKISVTQTDLPCTIYAQLFIAPNFLSSEFTPVPETLMELGTFATGSPAGSALAASVRNLNINVLEGNQLMIGFYNITAEGGLVAGSVGYLSGVVRIEDK